MLCIHRKYADIKDPKEVTTKYVELYKMIEKEFDDIDFSVVGRAPKWPS